MMTDLLLLHGALGDASTLGPLSEALERKGIRCHTLQFSGHGGQPVAGEFSIARFARELAQWLEQHAGLLPIPVFGYSMGGYVALYQASQGPDQLCPIITLGTKFDWSPEQAAQEQKHLDPAIIQARLPRFAALLAARHAPTDWQEVMRQTAGLMTRLGTAPLLHAASLAKIKDPVYVMLGSEDQMVTRSESKKAARQLASGTFISLADQPHPIEKVDHERLSEQLLQIVNSIA